MQSLQPKHSHKFPVIVGNTISAIGLATCLLLATTSPAQAEYKPITFNLSKFSKMITATDEATLPPPVNRNTAYTKLIEVERQVYGREYPEQDDAMRITRLEQSLFGNRQLGNLDVRYQRVVGRLNEKNTQSSQNNQARMLDYMEQKLFGQTFETTPISNRLKRLEAHVFGKSFETYPQDVRFTKLSYALPVMSKGVRVSSRTSGMVVASTEAPPPQTLAMQATSLSLAPASLSIPAEPMPEASAIGDYAMNVHRQGAGKALRWQKLPVAIHIHYVEPQDLAAVKEAVEEWGQTFPIALSSSATEADVIIDGRPFKSNLLITRPVLQLDSQQHIRTTVLVQAYPLLSLNANERKRALLHQIGHAIGIWGHSDDSNDIMYPLTVLELNDISPAWLRRSPRPYQSNPTYPKLNDMPQVSQRDRNTLTQLYSLPAQDLKVYVPNQP